MPGNPSLLSLLCKGLSHVCDATSYHYVRVCHLCVIYPGAYRTICLPMAEFDTFSITQYVDLCWRGQVYQVDCVGF